MIGRGIAASLLFAALTLNSAPSFAADNQTTATPSQPQHSQTVRDSDHARKSSDTTATERAIPAKFERAIVGVGPQALTREHEYRDIAMAPTG